MKTIFKSLLAGIVIGIGGWIYLLCPNKIVGAMLFSFGLYTVVTKKYALYTGLIGFAKFKDLFVLGLILFFNLVGAILSGLGASCFCGSIVTTLIENKLTAPLYLVLLKAIMCGVMMYLAVSGWNTNQSPINILCPVAIFILCGFEHCVADMFYFAAGQEWGLDTIKFMATTIVGNTIGALGMCHLENNTKERETK